MNTPDLHCDLHGFQDRDPFRPEGEDECLVCACYFAALVVGFPPSDPKETQP